VTSQPFPSCFLAREVETKVPRSFGGLKGLCDALFCNVTVRSPKSPILDSIQQDLIHSLCPELFVDQNNVPIVEK
jgi:hypothetical protein